MYDLLMSGMGSNCVWAGNVKVQVNTTQVELYITIIEPVSGIYLIIPVSRMRD